MWIATNVQGGSVMREYKQFINGSLQASRSGGVIEVENPYTRKIVATVPEIGRAHV
jgi:acyl-CoA reductase-like NAD-dependent aldehyde dehydrogenase